MIKYIVMKSFNALIICLLFYVSAIAQDATAINKGLRATIEELKDFVSLPNDAIHPDDMDQNLAWLNEKFSERGFNTKLISTSGIPLFFAQLSNEKSDAPTMLIYMHFDGQSVDKSKWYQEDPYKVVLKEKDGDQWKDLEWHMLRKEINPEWRLFGRSTSDDKGPIVMLLNAIDMLRADQQEIPFHIKVILDGEEEKSSKPLPQAVKDNRDLLEADILIINDGPVHPSNNPTLVYGCRGITSMSVTTFGPINPQHSGHFGNYAPNPGFRLFHLLGSMKDENGRVLIDGYYDGIELDEMTQEVLRSVPDDIAALHERLAIRTPEAVGAFYQESLQYPSLNIRGLSSGWVGDKARTIVPEKATAEIDLRLVVETDGSRLKSLVKDHIESKGYFIVDRLPTHQERMTYPLIAMVKEGPVTDAFRTDLNDPYGKWMEKVLQDTFNENLVKIRTMGGTVPIAPFINELNIPAIILPLVNPDNNQHSPNENLRLGQINYGLQVFYNLLSTEIN